MSLVRRVAALVGVLFAGLLLTSCALVPGLGGPAPDASGAAPSPAPTPVTLTVESGGVALRVRHVPAAEGNELTKVPSGASIVVDCQVKGGTVTGSQGTTDAWLHVTHEGKTGFVSAAFVAGSKTAQVPACPVVPAVATTPRSVPAASPGTGDVGATIAAIARSQVGVAEKGKNCHAYGTKCEEWCGYFASWVWGQAGIKVPVYPFTGDFYAWGQRNKRAHEGVTGVAVGDLVLYGTGPKTVKTSTHVDVVVGVYPDHLRVVGGNVDDRVTERDVPLTGIYGYVSARG